MADCISRQDSTTHFKSFNGQCWPKHHISYVNLHQMTFSGFNMLLHTPTGTSTTCEYGGLFILNYKHPHTYANYLTICSNVTADAKLPYVQSKGTHMMVIFVTFRGYSHGVVDLTMAVDKECIGLNYLYFSHKTTFPGFMLGDPITKEYNGSQVTQCSEFWITHNLLSTWFTPFTKLHYDFNSIFANELRGAFTLVTSGYVISQSTPL